MGKKLVTELKLDNSGHTLGRWMAHYLAELMVAIENEKLLIKKRKLQNECCDIILKIWSDRKILPNKARPLSNLDEAIQVLNGLSMKEKNVESWSIYMHEQDAPPWENFVRKISRNYNNVIALSLISGLSEEILEREKEWLLHSELLSEEEKIIIQQLDELIGREEYVPVKIVFSTSGDDDKEKSKPTDRKTKALNKLEELIARQHDLLTSLRKSLTKPDPRFPDNDPNDYEPD